MNIEKLFSGVGLVIDDNINNVKKGDSILKIVNILEEKNIPLVKKDSIPNEEILTNCKNLNFILLDWELYNLYDESGMPIPNSTVIEKDNEVNIIKFLKAILKECFVPIFIFSNKDANSITNILERELVIQKDIKSPIFVKSKIEIVIGDNVLIFQKIEEWLNTMPSVYVLKEWDNSFLDAKTNLFQELLDGDVNWPHILWETFASDGVDGNEELAEVLTQNILSRMQPVQFEKELIIRDNISCDTDKMLTILKAQRFSEKKDLENSNTGDFFLIKGKYKLNIRPACDCVGRDGKKEVYLIDSRRIVPKKCFLGNYGTFSERNNEAIVGPLYEKKYYTFIFKTIEIVDYDEIKNFKVGRILMPFITHITERYGLYIQRQGLPRIPVAAIPNYETNTEDEEDKKDKEIEELKGEISEIQKEKKELMKQNIKIKSYRLAVRYLRCGRNKKL